MNLLKIVFLTLFQLVKQVWQFPQNILESVRQRRRESEWTAREADRLDRIRNPAKYLGK